MVWPCKQPQKNLPKQALLAKGKEKRLVGLLPTCLNDNIEDLIELFGTSPKCWRMRQLNLELVAPIILIEHE